MKPLLLDTNVLVRFVTGEPADQAGQVADLFAAAEAGAAKLAISPLVLAEAVFVLTGFYGHPRAKVAEVLGHLVSCPGVHADDHDCMARALRLFGAGKLDFVDCYLAATSITSGREIVSFDRDFDKLDGVVRKSPAGWSPEVR